MRKEIKRAFTEPLFFLSMIILFLCLQGFALPSYISDVVNEPLEYRASALTLILGGVFFGGVIMLLPFCAAMAYATSQVDDIRSSMLHWSTLRGGVAKYALNKIVACFMASAVSAGAAFAFHAAMWHILALPYDPIAFPSHEIGFWSESFFAEWSNIQHGLPIIIEMTIGIAFASGAWSVVALATAVWMPDKLLTVVIPACVYKLWNANLTFYLFGFTLPSPDTIFNDAQSIQRNLECLLAYGILLVLATLIYYFGLKRRVCNA